MAERFITRKSDALYSLHRTQAKATAEAATDTAITAVTGAVEVPDNARRGWPVTAAGVFTNPEDVPLSAAEQKRVAVRAASGQLDRWDAGLTAQGRGQPSVIIGLGHDLILGQRKALYLRAVTSTLSVAAIKSYAEQLSRGASDITNVATFFRLASGLTKGVWVDGDPVEWATLTGDVAARRGLQAAITAAPTDFRVGVRDFSAIDLGTDAWIDGITA